MIKRREYPANFYLLGAFVIQVLKDYGLKIF